MVAVAVAAAALRWCGSSSRLVRARGLLARPVRLRPPEQGRGEGPETQAASEPAVPYAAGHLTVLRPPACPSVVTGLGEADGLARPIVRGPCLLPHDPGAPQAPWELPSHQLLRHRDPRQRSSGQGLEVRCVGSLLKVLREAVAAAQAATGARASVRLLPPRRAQVPRLRATCHCVSTGLLPDMRRVAVQAVPHLGPRHRKGVEQPHLRCWPPSLT